MSLKKYSSILRERGIRPSLQRLAIYEYISNNHTHPTAEEIYNALAPHILTLSRTTVYNTLRLFTEKGAAQTITIEENEMRFDVVVEPHGHFKCNHCGKIIDFPLDTQSILKPLPSNFTVTGTHFYTYGTCGDCVKNAS